MWRYRSVVLLGQPEAQTAYDTELQIRNTTTTPIATQIALVTRLDLNHEVGAPIGGPNGDLRGGQLMMAG